MDNIREKLRQKRDQLFNYARQVVQRKNKNDPEHQGDSATASDAQSKTNSETNSIFDQRSNSRIGDSWSQRQVTQPETNTNAAGDSDMSDADIEPLQQTLQILQEALESEPDGHMSEWMPEPKDAVFEEKQVINYGVEFMSFLQRNAPYGLSEKVMSMTPFLAMNIVSWPAYWLYRGYNWQYRRGSERIGVYIQRSFQHAKFIQLALLGAGLLVASRTKPPQPPSLQEINDMRAQ